jgi:hypothetical protein
MCFFQNQLCRIFISDDVEIWKKLYISIVINTLYIKHQQYGIHTYMGINPKLN